MRSTLQPRVRDPSRTARTGARLCVHVLVASQRIRVHFSPDAAEMVERAAALSGESVSEFLRVAGFARAAFTLAEHEPELVAHWSELYSKAQEVSEAAREGGMPSQ